MKRRVRKIANFFAFNLLFFALYLNFIHKDKIVVGGGDQTVQPKAAAFSGTVMVDNPEQYLQKNTEQSVANQPPVSAKTEQNDGMALKLSIN